MNVKLTHNPLSIMTGIDNFKITDAQQANVISNFKSAKQKLLKPMQRVGSINSVG
jgi:hypothetical protein